MDEFQRRVTRSALAVLGRYGFALAGGYAVAAYGIIDRPSDDVDLFTDQPDPEKFEKAMIEAISAWEAEGFTTHLALHSGTFARFYVSDGHQEIKVELCHDWRSEPPVILDVGPVLSRDNSVGNKVAALFSRSESRDYIDVYGARANGYSRTQLEEFGIAHDAGFTLEQFAYAITSHRRYPDSEFKRYNMTATAVSSMRTEYDEWATDIRNRT
ncbi:MAG: nucleotidyl transferase AbiEii/AbiGii toxin family protein [Gordonia sp. (in: high G+C Gram-positive bacteria)]